MSAADHLPPLAPAPAAEPAPLVRARRQIDTAVAFVVLAFAFLCASFVARNSDIWMHLAGGRLLAQGNYRFGVDPFAYTTEGVYWTNHSWLFDLIAYGLFHTLGGAGLVVAKAAVIAVLAAFLLGVRRPDQGLALPALCTLLAVLAMSPRLLLQPICLSFLFLGVTLWLLAAPAGSPAAGRRRLFALPVLFALWANLDSWFLLGPLTVALYWVGEQVQGAFSHVPAESDPARRRTLLAVLAVGVAACLLNPHHVHVFELPQHLSLLFSPTPLREDVRFQHLFITPWRPNVYFQPAVGRSIAGVSYFVLFGVSLVSFALNYRGVRTWRALVWVAFAVLGALQFRLVPFFAIVAGPVTALNLQDFVARRTEAVNEWHRSEVRLSLGVLLAGLVLAALAWPGWLQAWPFAWPEWLHVLPNAGRHAGWSLQPNPSLHEAALALADWHRQGKFADGGHGFQSHPDLADYCAWFCPEEKGFLDHRYELFPREVVAEYEEVCKAFNPILTGEGRLAALNPAPAPPGGGDAEGKDDRWRAIFHTRDIRRVELYNAEFLLLLPELSRFWADPREWPMLYLGGRNLMFGWAPTAEAARQLAPLRFEPARLAFGRPSEELLRTAPPAPGRAPDLPGKPPNAWEQFWKPPPPRSWESDTTSLYLRYFEEKGPAYRARQVGEGWGNFAAGAAAENVGTTPLAAAARLAFRLRFYPLYFPQAQDEGPPEALLLAVRAARDGLAADPTDVSGQLLIGQAYLFLKHRTRERAWDADFRLLDSVRHGQAVTAMEAALRLGPNADAAEVAHDTLAALYRERGYLDAALDHVEQVLRLAQARGARPGEGVENFTRRVQQLEKNVEELRKAVQARQNDFVIRSEQLGDNPFAKAQLAFGMGLARQALDDILLSSEASRFGPEGARLELDLLLLLGRAERARSELSDEDLRRNKERLGLVDLRGSGRPGQVPAYRVPAYDWLDFLTGAAVGDYDRADEAVQAILKAFQASGQVTKQQYQRALAIQVAAEVGQAAQRFLPGQPVLVRSQRESLVALLQSTAFEQRLERADFSVLGGMLMLERGLPEEAARYFRAALELAQPLRKQGRDFAGRPVAEAYLRRIEEAQR